MSYIIELDAAAEGAEWCKEVEVFVEDPISYIQLVIGS